MQAIMQERQKKKRAKQFKKACGRVLKFALSTAGLLVINFGVMGLGGYIFSKLELDNEIQSCISAERDYFENENNTLILIMDIAQQMDSSGPLSDSDLMDIQISFRDNLRKFSLAVLDSGFSYDIDCNTKEHDWRFLNSLLFAITIVTTIGMSMVMANLVTEQSLDFSLCDC